MLRCRDGSFYVGHTDNLDKRFKEHQAGEGARFTSSRLPITLAWSEQFASRDAAKAAETRLKGWSRAKKKALVARKFDVISALASRSGAARALRDASPLREEAPQGRGFVAVQVTE